MSLTLLEGFEDGHFANKVFADMSISGSGTSGLGGLTTLKPKTGLRAWEWAFTVRLPVAGRHTDQYVGFNMQSGNVDSNEQTNNQVIAFGSETTTPGSYQNEIILAVTLDGQLVVYRTNSTGKWNFSGTPLATSALNVIHPHTHHYIEIYCKLADASGRFIVKVDGATVIDFTGDTRFSTTGSGTVDRLWFGTGFGGHGLSAWFPVFDDVYVVAGDGVAPSGFLGPIRVYHLYPNGNGFYSQLTGSDGNQVDNYLQVDEGNRDTVAGAESDYNGSDAIGDKDTYTLTDPPVLGGTVVGAELRVYAAKSDTPDRGGRLLVRRAGVDSVGPDHVLALSYVTYRRVMPVDPTDGGAWTLTRVNDLEAGWEVRPIS